MAGYFRPCQNFKFEKSSIGRWLKSKNKIKNKNDWRTSVKFGLARFEIFYWSIKRVEFFVPRQLYGRKFLRIVEIEFFLKQKVKKNTKAKNEK